MLRVPTENFRESKTKYSSKNSPVEVKYLNFT